ncbi:cupin domain-containing protein [Cytobacillus sp. IB215665]|uniref:cupin domain-containing protein n=1 Tax=Cytobacillus sp. IB215665 TaxID=3097357 RepID=UPI002A1369DF|nr:cupin domain-containing protein [Cytobacillus sp. IB215665]MDX8367739.1 cupin domain-containing protein [Cytobacillus sp. IB215665]
MFCVPYMYQHSNNVVNGPILTYRNPTPYCAPSNKIYSPYPPFYSHNRLVLRDYGANPFVLNINEATKQNNTYRTAIWTGKHFQVTLMSLNVSEDIGLEIHPNTDQFLRVEQGQGIVQMGKQREDLSFQKRIFDDSAIMIPAGMWHNVINTGNVPLKLYSIYAPPNHPFGTIHRTKADAMALEEGYGNRDGIQ